MKTKYITSVLASFNPFSPPGKVARTFLALLPPDARQTMKVNVKVLARASTDDAILNLTFKDKKEMKLDLSKVRIKDIKEEVDRHSRMLGRKDELSSN